MDTGESQTVKRVLLLSDYFRPEPGGLEGLFTGLARQWDAGSVEVIVSADRKYYFHADEDLRRFDAGENYSIHRPGAVRGGLPVPLPFLKRKPGSFDELFTERLNSFRPEHVLLSDINRTARIAAAYAYLAGIPYSVFLTGGDLRTKLGFTRILERRLVLGARNLFAISRYVARDARGFGVPEDRITVLPPGLEPRWGGRKRAPLPEKLEERIHNRAVVLGLGPFVARKGFDVAIRAMMHLRDLQSRVHLVLTGSGPEFAYLKELIQIHELGDMVSLTGFLSDAALLPILERTHVVVQPGANAGDEVESPGTVFMEAAWFGIPVIAGRVGGADEIVRHGVSGFLIEPGNDQELADKLRQLVDGEKLRDRFGKNARDIARRDFDLERTRAAIESRL